MNASEYASLIDAIWKANAKNVADIGRQSTEAFPPPPIMANLEILSDHQFSKLLADTQKRAFYLGALAMASMLDEVNRAAKQ